MNVQHGVSAKVQCQQCQQCLPWTKLDGASLLDLAPQAQVSIAALRAALLPV
jgi:hypothetical protein